MSFDIANLERIRKRFETNFLELIRDVEQSDPAGNLTNAIIFNHEVLAVAAFVLDDDILAFREHLSASSKLRVDLFDRVNAGESIWEGHVDPGTFPSMLHALAAADFTTAKNLASNYADMMQDFDMDSCDCVFDADFCAILSNVIIEKHADAQDHLAVVRKNQGDMHMYCGYCSFFDFLLGAESPFTIDMIFKRVEHSYSRECQEGGMFEDTVEELLSVWGIGLANLTSRLRPAIQINYDSQLIPRRLLMVNSRL